MSAPAWLDTLPADHGRLHLHADVAEAVRARPRRWRLVGEYDTREGARDVAACIRRGGTRAWRRRPDGQYHAKFFTTDAGEHVVYVHWTPTSKTAGVTR